MFEFLRGRANAWIDHVGKTLATPIEMIFDYLDNGTINALAVLKDDRGFIMLNRGAMLLTIDTFNRILANPKVLPDIGDCSAEVVNAQHSEGLSGDWDQLVQN